MFKNIKDLIVDIYNFFYWEIQGEGVIYSIGLIGILAGICVLVNFDKVVSQMIR
jgi:uncharacterized membrane protein HdeD (DUF308 family)